MSLTQSPLAAPGRPAQWSAAGFEVAALWGGPAVSSYCSRGVAPAAQRWELVRGLSSGREGPALVFFSHPLWGFLPGSHPPRPPSRPWDIGLSASGEAKWVAGETEAGACPPALWDHQESTPSSGFLRADCMPSVRHRKHARLPLHTLEVRPSGPAGTRGYQPHNPSLGDPKLTLSAPLPPPLPQEGTSGLTWSERAPLHRWGSEAREGQ